VQSLGVVPGGGQQLRGDLGAHAVHLEQAGVGLFDQRLEQRVQIADLLAERGVAAGQPAERDLGGGGGSAGVGGVRAQGGAAGHQLGVAQPAQPRAQPLRCGDQ
jgi:hypothetical protein